jgi:hypothetical protein
MSVYKWIEQKKNRAVHTKWEETNTRRKNKNSYLRHVGSPRMQNVNDLRQTQSTIVAVITYLLGEKFKQRRKQTNVPKMKILPKLNQMIVLMIFFGYPGLFP